MATIGDILGDAMTTTRVPSLTQPLCANALLGSAANTNRIG